MKSFNLSRGAVKLRVERRFAAVSCTVTTAFTVTSTSKSVVVVETADLEEEVARMQLFFLKQCFVASKWWWTGRGIRMLRKEGLLRMAELLGVGCKRRLEKEEG
jgi:hypothetical protein